jgi:hypothetical protein
MMLALLGRIHDSNTTLPFDDLHVALSLCWRRREGQEEPEKRRIEQERPDGVGVTDLEQILQGGNACQTCS